MSEKKMEEMELPDVEILLANFIVLLGNKAYDCLGLIPKEGSTIDLKQAKLAIDSMGAIIEAISPMIDTKQSQDFRNLLSTLRMAYVQKAGNQPK